MDAIEKVDILSERIMSLPSGNEQIDLLSRHLERKVDKRRNTESGVEMAVISEIISKHGIVNLSELCQCYTSSKRTIERKFKETVGVSAKFFARLTRFQSSLELIRQGKFGSLSEVAHTMGYADQSHFTRDFREFSGSRPKHFFDRCHEVVNNFPEWNK
ncbi:MAG: helix-turn-helix domain-containing protein [Bacteroidota bacterium]